MTMITAAASGEHELMKLRDEYESMPGLCLNVQQVARLVGVDRDCATNLLEELAAEGLLLRASDGIYRRSSPLMS